MLITGFEVEFAGDMPIRIAGEAVSVRRNDCKFYCSTAGGTEYLLLLGHGSREVFYMLRNGTYTYYHGDGSIRHTYSGSSSTHYLDGAPNCVRRNTWGSTIAIYIDGRSEPATGDERTATAAGRAFRASGGIWLRA